MVKERSIPVCILLTIVTCGIYGIIWFISLTDDARVVSGDERLSGGKALLFTIVTCGIYSIYWAYQMGKALNQAQVKAGKTPNDNSVLYLILSIIGLSIVGYCLMQSELNNFANTTNSNGQGA
ncbi:MAG: DUF4234 domain-containing protein [Bacilli bacterium]|nr:DUF4234 domain-containing protein [Bacilli bacterium]